MSAQIQDKSTVIYTFTKHNIIESEEGTFLFKFPYEKDVFWTSFRFNVKGEKRIRKFTTTLITKDNYEYTFGGKFKNMSPNTWHNLKWIIPSININNEHSGIYIDTPPTNYDTLDRLTIQLLGYKNLLPKNEHYILTSNLGYEYVLSQYDNSENGVIYNVEGIDYIRDILDSAQIINVQV
jgi:hypothetical protein